MARQKNFSSSNGSTANLGFEAKLQLTADKLRIKCIKRSAEHPNNQAPSSKP